MFKGIQKVSVIDFPGRIASTLFTGGCNFRCPWCHNWDLVDPVTVAGTPELAEDDVKTYLEGRRDKLQGVCVTGGEPTLWGGRLLEFFRWCKSAGFQTKLDTNGYLPSVLEGYLREGVLDFVAMDVKNTFDKYPATVGLENPDVSLVKRSIEIIRASGVEHQFRTTVVTGLVDADEIREMEKVIGDKIVLQEYRPVEELMIEEAERRG